MALMLYTVLAASGGYVAGQEVAIGALIPLTDEEARYELALGTIAPTGQVPVVPAVPVLLPADLVATQRLGIARPVPLSALETYLLREAGLLDAYLTAREQELAAAIIAQSGSIADLLGGVAPEFDTLAKIAAVLTGVRTSVETLTAQIAPRTF